MTEDQHPTPQPENDTANPAVRVWPGGRQKMDSYSNLLTVAPFYYGSKRRWAAEVWRRFGQVEVYTEPFCGSAAVTLNCPYDLPNVTLYDRSSLICNLLRAVKADPEAVTEHCIRPLVHLDLIAAAKYLIGWEEKTNRLAENLDYYDAEVAGLWWWVQVSSIAGLYRQGNARPRRSRSPKVRLMSADPKARPRILRMLSDCQKKLASATVVNASWENGVKKPALYLGPGHKDYDTPRAVFLDPPYKDGVIRQGLMYGQTVEDAVAASDGAYAWAVENGNNELLRIAFCCGVGHYPCPDGWQAAKPQLYIANRHSTELGQVIYFSPHCFKDRTGPASQQELFAGWGNEEAARA